MKTKLLKIAIRQNAIIIPEKWIVNEKISEINKTTSVLLTNAVKLGYTFSEELLHKINTISPIAKLDILTVLKEVKGVNKNWTPLVKQWNISTGETIVDHAITFFANVFKLKNGTTLACGHVIPNNTFPLERYNGCPFCGTPFEFAELDYEVGKNKLKTLELWTDIDIQKYLMSLLNSSVALDATQVDSLKILLENFELPKNVKVGIKETLMLLIDTLVAQEKEDVAGTLFKTPNDILRYLWYKHTGFLQIIEPKTIVKRLSKNGINLHPSLDNSQKTKRSSIANLKLKYNRTECRRYAKWLNELDMDITKQCEIMHPKRGMWVRIIRALRLAEYSKRKGFENVAKLLNVFYNEQYEVWQGTVNHFKLKADAENTFVLLKQRPGLFARSLFSSMLWFGQEITLSHFREIMDKVPSRLIFTLNMYAEIYFDKSARRNVKPLGGVNKKISVNKMLQLYGDKELEAMKAAIQTLTLDVIKNQFASKENANKTIYIDKGLYNIPIAIGDRSETIQDSSVALMGTRFQLEGDKVRLFLQWGKGLPAQHLDMDLSCSVAYTQRTEICSYSQLVIAGCKHSGDIQHIPNKVGTAEYIEIELDRLKNLKAKYVTFTCNAYTNGSLSPNLVVGWMNSKHPMKISKSGVAYNPTAVQHQVRIQQNILKGLVFGILDVQKREIIWLEMSFAGQIIQNLSEVAVEALLKKLDAKLKIAKILELKAEAQNLKVVDELSLADEVYDIDWALNTAEVSKLLLA